MMKENPQKKLEYDRVIAYLKEHPGSTLPQVSQGTKVSMGRVKEYIDNGIIAYMEPTRVETEGWSGMGKSSTVSSTSGGFVSQKSGPQNQGKSEFGKFFKNKF